jgi:microcystin-dependent protein
MLHPVFLRKPLLWHGEERHLLMWGWPDAACVWRSSTVEGKRRFPTGGLRTSAMEEHLMNNNRSTLPMRFNLKKTLNGVAAMVAGTAFIGAAPAHACNDQPYMGTVCMTAAIYCPRGYAEADGRLLSISQNSALFALLGDTYGGDGRTTFALPDLRGRSPMGMGAGPGLSPIKQGQRRGTEQTALNTTHLPTHNHTATFTPTGNPSAMKASTAGGSTTTPSSGTYLAAAAQPSGSRETPDNIYTTDGSNLVAIKGLEANTGGEVSVNNTGSGAPFTTVPPQLGIRYCVAMTGLFPPRE